MAYEDEGQCLICFLFFKIVFFFLCKYYPTGSQISTNQGTANIIGQREREAKSK